MLFQRRPLPQALPRHPPFRQRLPASLPAALEKAYAAADKIHFDKLHRRSDIGARALKALAAGK